MGTRALPADRWLWRDHFAASEIALRRRLLAEQRPHVFACTGWAEAPARETAGLVEGWAATQPDLGLGSPDEAHPLARAGSLVQEDLCLMVHHDGAWHLEGAVLCFPSLWVLAEKLGQPTSVVHGPVPFYAEELSTRVDTFFDRLAPGKPVWRRNLSLWPTLLLWAPLRNLEPAWSDPLVAPAGEPNLWLRTERQTLRRLPETGAILFTIRVQTAPVGVLAQRPSRARDLAAWLRAPAGQTRRGQIGPALGPLLGWLDGVGDGGAGSGGSASA
ncbi:MAG TPA: DUF3445 domain-containing protein [Acidimicrobiales bacterium]|nr:DUF3445 domain-containing protein [Acidimicrobiales bacterium]